MGATSTRGCYTAAMSSVVALFVAAAVAGAGTAPPATTDAPAPVSDSAAAPTSTPPPVSMSPGEVRGAWGVGLLAAGAGLATGSVVGLTLLESVTTPDREKQPVTASQETLRSVGGFTSAAIAGVSVVAMVVGGGLAISAGLDARGAPSSTPAE
jgi:hypothetical protein